MNLNSTSATNTLAGMLYLSQDIATTAVAAAASADGAEDVNVVGGMDNVSAFGEPGSVGDEGRKEMTRPDIFGIDYEDLHHSGFHNISGEQWYNYSCHSLELPTDFLKNVIEPLICCCGIVGIIVTMVVLTRKNMCSSCNCYLTALAAGDLIYVAIVLARFIVDNVGDCNFHLGSEAVIFQIYSIIVQDICLYLTIGVTVMLAVERYIAICHPMRAMGMCTVKRACTIIAALAVIAFILRSPKFFDIQFSYSKTHSGESTLVVTYVYLYNDAIYTYIVSVCLTTVLPLLVLLVLNIRIITEIRRSARYLRYYLGVDWRVRSVVSREELKITMMLLGVVITFFICHVPYMVLSLVVAFNEYESTNTQNMALKYFRSVCHSLLAFRSSCNFILYCWFSEKFWMTFKKIFCLMTCPSKQSTHRPNGYNNNGRHSRFNSSHTTLYRSSTYITKETTC